VEKREASTAAYPLRTAWVCVCGHRNTPFATACYGGCGRDLPATLDEATAQGIEVHLISRSSRV
jgi:hypothetical protein